jgi:hypothetical protein
MARNLASPLLVAALLCIVGTAQAQQPTFIVQQRTPSSIRL